MTSINDLSELEEKAELILIQHLFVENQSPVESFCRAPEHSNAIPTIRIVETKRTISKRLSWKFSASAFVFFFFFFTISCDMHAEPHIHSVSRT